MKTAAPRPYRMKARAESKAATRRAISSAFLALFAQRHYDDVTLDAVAARAGVTVQTVIRHFGSKDGLFAAAVEDVARAEEAGRAATPAGSTARAVRVVVGRYEHLGDVVLRLLAQEDRLPALHEAADYGRRFHREWVERAFAPHLDGLAGEEHRRRRAQLVALTDIYVWKLLRRDAGFGRRRTEEAMTEMVDALLQGGS
jgi:AcrR family transcriptional regulator